MPGNNFHTSHCAAVESSTGLPVPFISISFASKSGAVSTPLLHLPVKIDRVIWPFLKIDRGNEDPVHTLTAETFSPSVKLKFIAKAQ